MYKERTTYLILTLDYIKADLLAQYGGVAPKMAEEAHSQVIDQVLHVHKLCPLDSIINFCYLELFVSVSL